MSCDSDVTSLCQELLDDLRNELKADQGEWKFLCAAQSRPYGCRLVLQLFDKEGANLKLQMLMRVEGSKDFTLVHEFLRSTKQFLQRYLRITCGDSKEAEPKSDYLQLQASTLKVRDSDTD